MNEKLIIQKLKFYYDYLKLMDLYPEDFEKAFGGKREKEAEVDRILDQIIFYKNLQRQIRNKKNKENE